MDFEQLRAERQALNNAVLPHGKSIEQFGATGLPWFRLTLEEVVESSDGVRHLSTSASCIESLSDVPAHQDDAPLAVELRGDGPRLMVRR